MRSYNKSPVLHVFELAFFRVFFFFLSLSLCLAPSSPYSVAFLKKAWLDSHPTAARHLRALGGAMCIQMLIVANLVGYSYGLKGASYLFLTVSNCRMWRFLSFFVMWLFAKTQLMLIIRQHERRASCPKLATSKADKDD